MTEGGASEGGKKSSVFRPRHITSPLPPISAAALPVAITAGNAQSFFESGAGLKRLDACVINGVLYFRPVPIGAPDPPPRGGPPPGPALYLLTRLHPDMRAAHRRAKRYLAARGWMADVRRWTDGERGAREAAGRALAAVDCASLSDGGLADHLEAIVAELARALHAHFEYTHCVLISLGVVLLEVDCADGEKKGTLADIADLASNPRDAWDHSASRPIYEAYARDATARAALDAALAESGDGAAAVFLAAASSGVAPAAVAAAVFLATVGDRVAGYDVASPSLRETPRTLLEAFAAAARTAPPDPEPRDASAFIARLPADRRTRAASLLADARRAFRVRDEKALYCDAWVNGIARRCLLEVGSRSAFADRENGCWLDAREADALLRGTLGADAVEKTAAARRERAAKFSMDEDAPAVINGPDRPRRGRKRGD